MKARIFLILATLLLMTGLTASVQALPGPYSIFNIGLIDPADYGGQGEDVSTMLGYATGRNLGDNNQAFLWTEEDGLMPLPNLASRPYAAGNGVNIHGTVVGTGATTFYGSSPLPLIWEGGEVAQLPLPAGQDLGRAEAISNTGLIVGSVNGGSLQRPALFGLDGSEVVTRATPTGCYGTTFFDVNDDGLAVGTGIDPDNAARNVGFCYDNGTDTAFEVGALEGANGALCFGISNAGHVVGSSMMNQGAGMPFIWTEADGMQPVPLPVGTSQGSAKGVNSDGYVVGTASSAYAIPFLYDGEATYPVADLLPEDSGWDLAENTSSDAAAISDEGIVVGTGVYEGGPKPYALVPDNVVPLLLQSFTAEGSSQGIEVTWELHLVNVTMSFSLERAASMDGPWQVVNAPVHYLGQISTVLDTGTDAGRTYYYRLLTTAGNDDLVMGYASAQRVGFAGVSLGAAMPNPAPGGTRLAYRLPTSQNVQITVHDLRGRLVRTLVNGHAGDGENWVQWDGKDGQGHRAPAGVYFVNLKTRQGNQTQRVVLTR